MDKIKKLLIASTIFLAILGSYAMKPFACENQPQFYWNGSTYISAGTYGVQYSCWDEPSVCTFYKPNPSSQPNVYAPCRTGVFDPIFGIAGDGKGN